MTRYAYFDHAQDAPQPVLGWYDTGLVDYGATLPASNDLLEVTDDTFWTNRLAATWGVDDGAFVNITPSPAPPPTELEQQAIAALAAGIQLTSLSTGSLNGTYDVSQPTQVRINGVMSGIGAGVGLPGGGATFNWPDTSGNAHAFSETNFKNFAAAVTNYTYTLNEIIAGTILPLPDFNITIA